MAMDSKNFIFNNPNRAFFGIFIVFWIVLGSFIVTLWNKYADSDLESAQNQLQVINNYLITIPPADTAAINNASGILLSNPETTIDKLFFSIYSKEGNLLFTNASASRNSTVLSFKNIDSHFRNDTVHYRSQSNIFHDVVLQKDCIITATYNDTYKRFIITECTVNNSTSVIGFIANTSTKLSLILLLIVIASICLTLLHSYIGNITRLKKYILQLSEEDDFKEQESSGITQKGGIKNITDDLYTLYKNKIEIIKQHDIEREQAILDEKAKLASKRSLANNLNHEIKTPIGIIIGYLDTLINHPDIDAKTRLIFLKKCLQNTQRLQNMVVNIAVISRLEDGSNNIALEDTNIWKVANLAKEDLKFTLSEYNMTFKNEIDPDTFVRANEMLLYNIFCNLIKNSCFYSFGSDIVLKVIAQNEQFITFSFSDNGKGVPTEALAKLFNRFYRLEKDKNQKSGTGLGLPIVKESINLCGGTISVSNRLEGGLEYTFTLPLA